MIKQSPYEILGLKGDFTFKDIKKAYRIATKANPPEQNPEKFSQISDAYDMLTNENYFIMGCKNNIFTVSVNKQMQNREKFNGKEYLKEIFEVPFL